MKYKPTDLLTVYLDVKQRRKVGRIAATNRQILFEYDAEFIASSIQISPFRLPLATGIAIGDAAVFDGLFGVFNDSLPDGWGRLLLDRAVERHGINRGQLTPLDRLAYVGRHGMGALVYEPDRTGDEGTTTLHLDRIAEESATVLAGEQDDVVEKLFKLNGASSGARPKIVAQVSADKQRIIHGPRKLPAGFSHWMVKFPSMLDAPDMGPIEYAYSLMAADAGVTVPETYLFGAKKKRYFGTKRFDRNGDARMHMHSLSGLVGVDHANPTFDYDLLLKVVAALTKDVREAERAFALACFNVLAHNQDDHAKNVSFLLGSDGQWALAPAYDLTFSSGQGGERMMMVMGEGKTPGVAHLLTLAKKHGISEAPEIIERVQSAVARWKAHASEAGVTKKSTALIERELEAIAKRDAWTPPPKVRAKKAEKKPTKASNKKSTAKVGKRK
ncbi:type II toxin-antitoxin system HipA family toxin [Hyphomicrobium sp.]|uniref:type II toxin-antitoxin system HipA family toxin n=1 Tax=Hyphomicrobium sp. TaxID=82 RepID=UPI003F6E7B29